MGKILIVDDEKAIREVLSSILKKQNFDVIEASTLSEAKEILKNQDFDVVLIDLLLPDGDGRELIPSALKKLSNVIMISGHASLETAIEAVKMGAYDFLEKPLDREKLLITVSNAVREVEFKRAVYKEIIFVSKKMKEVIETAEKFAKTDEPILILGETGSGKELLANYIHRISYRAKNPFVVINCPAIPSELAESELFGHIKGAFTGASETRKGKFLLANEGTIFFDEIGDLPLNLQPKLLRVIENNEIFPVGSDRSFKVNVRIISATNKNLTELIKEGKFREDLYFRISGLKIEIPPLRERKEDIEILARSFLKEAALKNGFFYEEPPKSFFEKLTQFVWRGNVRELKKEMNKIMILTEGKIDDDAIKFIKGENKSKDLKSVKRESEEKEIIAILRETKGNIKLASKLLKISRSNLYVKLKKYGINYSSFRGGK